MWKKNGEGTTKWFATKLGFLKEDLDIHKQLDDAHATLTECEAMQRKRKKHNGFKYEICTNPKIIVRVLELYALVYQKQ